MAAVCMRACMHAGIRPVWHAPELYIKCRSRCPQGPTASMGIYVNAGSIYESNQSTGERRAHSKGSKAQHHTARTAAPQRLHGTLVHDTCINPTRLSASLSLDPERTSQAAQL